PSGGYARLTRTTMRTITRMRTIVPTPMYMAVHSSFRTWQQTERDGAPTLVGAPWSTRQSGRSDHRAIVVVGAAPAPSAPRTPEDQRHKEADASDDHQDDANGVPVDPVAIGHGHREGQDRAHRDQQKAYADAHLQSSLFARGATCPDNREYPTSSAMNRA